MEVVSLAGWRGVIIGIYILGTDFLMTSRRIKKEPVQPALYFSRSNLRWPEVLVDEVVGKLPNGIQDDFVLSFYESIRLFSLLTDEGFIS